MMAEDIPQQHPVDEGGPAAQVVRQEEVDVNQSQTVELGDGDNNEDNTAEQIPTKFGGVSNK